MPFLWFWGRAPVLFWVAFSGNCFTLGCLLAPTFEVYYVMRVLQGLALTAGQTAGLAFIQDIFFFHEHARKIGIWTSLFLTSPYWGLLLANFILAGTGSWRDVFWLYFGLSCLNLLLVVLFLDETWYRRDIPQEMQPKRGNRIFRVIGIWQIRVHNGYFGTFAKSSRRLTALLIKPIMLPIMIY
jgi:predicted MFS family arabinose efflux permease